MNLNNIAHNHIFNLPGIMNTNDGRDKKGLAGSLTTKPFVILMASLAFVLSTASLQASDLEAKSSDPKLKFADTDIDACGGPLPGSICLPAWVITGNLSYFRLEMTAAADGATGERIYIDDYADMELNWGPGRWAVQDEAGLAEHLPLGQSRNVGDEGCHLIEWVRHHDDHRIGRVRDELFGD